MANARGIRAGAAYVELFVNDSKLVRGLTQASKKLKAFGDAITGWGQKMTAIGAAVTAPLLGSAKAFAEMGDRIAKASARTGVSVETLSELAYAATHLSEIHLPTLILSALVVIMLFVGRAVLPKVPWVLIVMIAAAVVVAIIGAERFGLALVGDVPRGLPAPSLPDVAQLELAGIVFAAVGVAALPRGAKVEMDAILGL